MRRLRKQEGRNATVQYEHKAKAPRPGKATFHYQANVSSPKEMSVGRCRIILITSGGAAANVHRDLESIRAGEA